MDTMTMIKAANTFKLFGDQNLKSCMLYGDFYDAPDGISYWRTSQQQVERTLDELGIPYMKDEGETESRTADNAGQAEENIKNNDNTTKEAEQILLLNMENLSPLTDYFIIASADNVTLVKAVADNIEEKLAEEGILPSHTEGYAEGRWILMDYGDCVAHIFLEEDRDFYNLEQLWADAPSESFAEEENE